MEIKFYGKREYYNTDKSKTFIESLSPYMIA